MVTSPGAFSFFSPRRRIPRPTSLATNIPSAAARAHAVATSALSPIHVPDEIQKNIERDLKDAFEVKGESRPGYEAGKVSSAKFNPIDFFLDPFETFTKTVGTVFDTSLGKLLPAPDVMWKESESSVWKQLFSSTWVDSTGSAIVPASLQQAVLRWTEATGSRVGRTVAHQAGILANPGLTHMMAKALAGRYATGDATIVGGEPLKNIIASSLAEENTIADVLNRAETATSYRDKMDLWEEASARQRAWADSTKGLREDVRGRFEDLLRHDPDLAASSEGQFYRYFQNRNLHHQTLNFLKTYKKGGAWGVGTDYVWSKFSKGLEKRLGHLYPPKALEWVRDNTYGRLLKPALSKLTEFQSAYKRFLSKHITDPLKELLKSFGEKIGLKALVSKFGIGRITALAGGPIGVVIGAVLAFLGEELMGALGGPLKLVLAVIAAVLGAFIVGTAMVIIFVTTILPGAIGNFKFPWEATAAAPITVSVQACSGSQCSNPLKLASGSYQITWKATIQNSGKSDLTGGQVSDQRCGLASSFDLKVGEIKDFSCTKLDSVSGTDTIIQDTFTFSSSTVKQLGIGVVILGTPPFAPPDRWPLAHGVVIQGPHTCDLGGSHCGGDDDQALDIDGGHEGETVVATHSGEVIEASSEWCGGNIVRIKSPLGFTSIYAHLARIDVAAQQQVFAGQPIGVLGSTGAWLICITGPHLHYALVDPTGAVKMAPPYIPAQIIPVPCGWAGVECKVSW